MNRELLDIIRHCTNGCLSFPYHSIKYSDLSELFAALKNTSITSLDLKYQRLDDAGAIVIARHLKGSAIKILNVSINGIGDAGAAALAACLKYTSLISLDLSINRITSRGLRALAASLPDSALENLNLRWNCQIRDTGFMALGAALGQLSSLTTLNLCATSFDDDAAIRFSEHLAGSKLTHLDLSNNSLTNVGVKALAKVLPRTQLTTLNLSDNRIGDEGAKALGDTLGKSKLITLPLSANRISRDGERALAEAIIPGLMPGNLNVSLGYHATLLRKKIEENHRFYRHIRAALISVLRTMQKSLNKSPQTIQEPPYRFLQQLDFYLPQNVPVHIKNKMVAIILEQFTELSAAHKTSLTLANQTLSDSLVPYETKQASEYAHFQQTFVGQPSSPATNHSLSQSLDKPRAAFAQEKTLIAHQFKAIINSYVSTSWLAMKWSPFSKIRSQEMVALKKFSEQLKDDDHITKQQIIDTLKTARRCLNSSTYRKRMGLFTTAVTTIDSTKATDKILKTLAHQFT